MSAPSSTNILQDAVDFIDRILHSEKWDGTFYTSYLIFLFEHIDELESARQMFFEHDPMSLSVFNWRQKYLILSSLFSKERIPFLEDAPYTQEKWKLLEEEARQLNTPYIQDSYLLDIIDTWILESYRLENVCEVKEGDVVLDCGAYTGNTSIYFSKKVGETGHVYGFEPSREIYAKYNNNTKELSNITGYNYAISKLNGKVFITDDNDPGTHIDTGGVCVDAVTVDTFVQQQKISRVDFIKMDIEGAERGALVGAQKTIECFHPKMAISAYHKYDDIFILPRIINSFSRRYRFYLRHFSNEQHETVMFCEPLVSEAVCNNVDTVQNNALKKMQNALLLYGKMYSAFHNRRYLQKIAMLEGKVDALKRQCIVNLHKMKNFVGK